MKGYFDYAATGVPYEEALSVGYEFEKKHFSNPSAQHKLGKEAYEKFITAKNRLCELCGFQSGRLLLGSNGSEMNNLVIESFLKSESQKKILIAEDAHISIWYAMDKYKDRVVKLNYTDILNFESNSFSTLLDESIGLICLSHVGNELGTLHPVKEIAFLCRQKGIQVHIDGAQALGHIPVKLDDIEFDSYSFSSHKFGASKGCGGLFFNQSKFSSLISGGQQEWGMRAGTQNVSACMSSVVALEKSLEKMDETNIKLVEYEKKIEEFLVAKSDFVLKNHPQNKVPGLLSFSFKGFSGSEIVTALSLEGIFLSTGSSCSENKQKPSRHIKALGYTDEDALGTIRISMGRLTNNESIILLLDSLNKILKTDLS